MTHHFLSLASVREGCLKVQEAANLSRLQHFDVDHTKLEGLVQFVVSIIKRDYKSPQDIPHFGQWRYFDLGGRPRLTHLIQNWSSLGEDKLEQTRKLIDLLVVAALLDMEPGQAWSYTEKLTGRSFKKKNAVAIAVLDLFSEGTFSSDPMKPHQVNFEALSKLELDTIYSGLKVTESNRFIGIEDRLEILNHLGSRLKKRRDYFKHGRPGDLIDYLLAHPTTHIIKKGPVIKLETLWPVALEIGELWSAEGSLGGTPGLGDVWPCTAIDNNLVSFHKLSQWLVYSIMEPMERMLGVTLEGADMLTPLPDYCNGGLLIDTGYLTLKPADFKRGLRNYRSNSLLPHQPKIEVAPMFEISDPVVIEWRALTVAYMELVIDRVRQSLKLSKNSLSLSQLIQGGTWSAGKELAEISRPNTHEPPIVIKKDKMMIY